MNAKPSLAGLCIRSTQALERLSSRCASRPVHKTCVSHSRRYHGHGDTVSCTHVTDVGTRHLSSLTELTRLYLFGTAQAGRTALKAALPALTIYWL